MLLGALFCPQNTEDVYTGEEQWVDNDTVICNKRITRGASEVRAPACLPASLPVCLLLNPVLVLFGMLSPPPLPARVPQLLQRIARYAINFAVKNNRSRVTALHKVCLCVWVSTCSAVHCKTLGGTNKRDQTERRNTTRH